MYREMATFGVWSGLSLATLWVGGPLFTPIGLASLMLCLGWSVLQLG